MGVAGIILLIIHNKRKRLRKRKKKTYNENAVERRRFSLLLNTLAQQIRLIKFLSSVYRAFVVYAAYQYSAFVFKLEIIDYQFVLTDYRVKYALL